MSIFWTRAIRIKTQVFHTYETPEFIYETKLLKNNSYEFGKNSYEFGKNSHEF